jgi:hypothetical protein
MWHVQDYKIAKYSLWNIICESAVTEYLCGLKISGGAWPKIIEQVGRTEVLQVNAVTERHYTKSIPQHVHNCDK